MLQSHPFVHLISLDFSKAFDSVRHAAVLSKYADLPIPAEVHNWVADFLSGREHCTKFMGTISSMAAINASIIQGSGLGPVSYVINCSDLKPCNPANKIPKYADDTYLLVSSSNSHTLRQELAHIESWAATNNLKLNTSKSKEMIIHWPHTAKKSLCFPDPIDGIERVTSISILGVSFSASMSFSSHVESLVASASSSLYALRTVRSHGLVAPALWDVTKATLLAKMMYASPAWWGFVDGDGQRRLQAIMNRLVKQGFLPSSTFSFSDACDSSDRALFEAVLSNPDHVLHQLLPPIRDCPYQLRARAHNRTLPLLSHSRSKQNFFFRMLYSDIY